MKLAPNVNFVIQKRRTNFIVRVVDKKSHVCLDDRADDPLNEICLSWLSEDIYIYVF